MAAKSSRAQSYSALALSFIASGFFVACTTDVSEDVRNGSSVISLRVLHLHYGEAGNNTVIIEDLPDTIRIRLNGIPGNFSGRPTLDTLYATSVSKNGNFRIPLDELSDFPDNTRPRPYVPNPHFFDSISPASVGIMRIGTFADGETGGMVLPDGESEVYGFYDMSLKTAATMVYFSGAARIHADYALCDSSRFKADIVIPGKGFYFLYQKTEGRTVSIALIPSAANLVFAVNTLSPDFNEYYSALLQSQRGCFTELTKSGNNPPLPPDFQIFANRRSFYTY